MTPQELQKRYRELATVSVQQGMVWRSRLRAICFGLLANSLAVVMVLCEANKLIVLGVAGIAVISALAIWEHGEAIFRSSLVSRQDALNEAKSLADEFGED